MKTAACYIRVSTDDQLEYSPDSQQKIIQDYAQNHQLILPEEFVFREDDGISGRKADKRPEFQRMIAAAKGKPHPFSVILVWKFSRFARNQEESIVYKSLLKRECGIEVISVSEPLIDGPFGSLIERIIEWMDEYYSIRLSGEVKRGMKERLSRGQPVSAAPYGYRWENGQFAVEPKAAEIVVQLFRQFRDGKNYRALTDWANRMGTGRLWENRTVEYVLRNPAYIGKLRSGTSGNGGRDFYGEQVEIQAGQHPPIVSMELWDAVQNRIQELKARYPKHARLNKDTPRLFSGVIRCSNCGKTLCAAGRSDAWQCGNYAKGKCRVSHYLSDETAKAVILPELQTALEMGGFRFSVTQKNPRRELDSGMIQRQIESEKQKLARVKEAYESGVDTLEEYKENRARIQARLDELKKSAQPQPEALEETPTPFPRQNISHLETLLDEGLPAPQRNAALRTFVDTITFYRTEKRLDIFYKL